MKSFFHYNFVLLIFLSSSVSALELSGNISLQARHFFDQALDQNQHQHYNSFAIEPEIYHAWDDDQQALNFTAFYRYDQHDEERTHADIRELSWLKVFNDWELAIGLSKVFWGVTESQHLVDIINQTDQVENTDGEDKLGQPMVRFSTEQDWGLVDFFILPGFRERTFSGIEGRPRFEIPAGLVFDTDAASFESTDKENHTDYAIRWMGFFDEIELGLSYFTGTGREPESFLVNGIALAPHYVLIKQAGLDVQAIIEDWTWKLELINRKSTAQTYNALTGGFEYTLYGILDSQTDLGIVIEYLYDERDELATSPFQNDLTTALRLALNDSQSSEILIGIISDLDDSTMASFIEASRRLGDSFKLTLEAKLFKNTIISRPLYNFRQDNHIQADIAWYF